MVLDDLHSSMAWVRSEVAKMEIRWSRNARADGSHMPGVLGSRESAPVRPSVTGDATDGPRFGHRDDFYHRDSGPWHPGANVRYPVTGMYSPHSSQPFSFHHPGSGGFHEVSRQMGNLPKLNFPLFDGTNPKLWQSKCEKYFHMYATEASMWVEVAIMHFEGVADRWLQSIEPQIASMSWCQFCQYIQDRFGREQHELVIRKLFHIRQISTVQDYVDRFCELIDLLVTYEHTTDPLYYTMKFIDGLHDNIKSVVLVQRPGNLDTACALALLQEEVESSRRQDLGRGDPHYPAWGPSKQAAAVNHRLGKAPIDSSKWTNPTPASSVDSKVASLRAYRRARGLCHFCAKKWSKGHKCAETVQLHDVQELWEMLSSDQPESEAEFVDSAEQFMILLSTEAASTKTTSKSFRLRGQLQGIDVVILLDSGSSHCFLSANHTSALSGLARLDTPLSVTMANGEVVQCTVELPQASWYIHGLEFCYSFKVIPLPYYDVILGMDWLEMFSPMTVDWKHKWLSLPHSGSTVVLQGCQPLVPACTILEIWPVTVTEPALAQLRSIELSLPAPVVQLLRNYESLF
jgi:hypothetical protein